MQKNIKINARINWSKYQNKKISIKIIIKMNTKIYNYENKYKKIYRNLEII